MDEAELRHIFAHCGDMTSVRVIPHRGCGFINFRTHEEALSAIEDMDGRTIRGQVLQVRWGKQRRKYECGVAFLDLFFPVSSCEVEIRLKQILFMFHHLKTRPLL